MTWTLEHNESPHYIHVTLFGSVSGPELHELTSAAIALLKKQGASGAFIDLIKLESVTSIIDIFDLADKQYDQEGLDRNVRIAMVLPVSHSAKQAAEFYETVCVNRGWLVQSFPGCNEAIEWLKAYDTSGVPL
jgi:hypothetical protein